MAILINEELCSTCRSCVDVCPEDIFLIKESKLVVEYAEECCYCGACMMDCPNGAIKVEYNLDSKPYVFNK